MLKIFVNRRYLPCLCKLVRRSERELDISISVCLRLIFGKSTPDFPYASPSSRKHTILQAVKALSMDWRQELSSGEAKQHA